MNARRRFSVMRKVLGNRVEWLILDELDQVTIAVCKTASAARRVRDALNATEGEQ